MSSKMVDHFVQQVQVKFEMSMVGEHTFFCLLSETNKVWDICFLK